MTLSRLLAFLVVLAVFPAAAEAHTTILGPPAGSGLPYQRWVDEARIPTPTMSVNLIEGDSGESGWPCHGSYAPEPPTACALQGQPDIYFDPTGSEPRLTLYHELGHIADAAALTAADRAWFAAFVEVPVEPWFSEATHDTAGEDFASVYAVCLRFGLHVRFTQMELEDGRYIYPRRHFRLCRWIESVTAVTS